MTNFYIKYHIHPISFKAQGIACSLFCLNVLSVTKKPKAMKTKTQYTKNEIKYCPLHDFDYTSKIINQHFFAFLFLYFMVLLLFYRFQIRVHSRDNLKRCYVLLG